MIKKRIVFSIFPIKSLINSVSRILKRYWIFFLKIIIAFIAWERTNTSLFDYRSFYMMVVSTRHLLNDFHRVMTSFHLLRYGRLCPFQFGNCVFLLYLCQRNQTAVKHTRNSPFLLLFSNEKNEKIREIGGDMLHRRSLFCVVVGTREELRWRQVST